MWNTSTIMREMKKQEWKMPDWMEPYRDLFVNTGGNSIEELMNDYETTLHNNLVRGTSIVSVGSQVTFLHRLKAIGELAAQLDEAKQKKS